MDEPPRDNTTVFCAFVIAMLCFLSLAAVNSKIIIKKCFGANAYLLSVKKAIIYMICRIHSPFSPCLMRI